MYGMVNQAIKKMVEEKEGYKLWERVCSKLSMPTDDFYSFDQYDDEITLNVIVTICEVAQMEAPVVLKEFGRYWIEYAFNSEYKAILNTFSKSPVALIKSLNSLHERLEMTFEDLRAPSFDIVLIDDGEMIVNYYSDRKMPLEYFVIGLFYGIFEHFGEKCEVHMIRTIENAKATFVIKYDEPK